MGNPVFSATSTKPLTIAPSLLTALLPSKASFTTFGSAFNTSLSRSWQKVSYGRLRLRKLSNGASEGSNSTNTLTVRTATHSVNPSLELTTQLRGGELHPGPTRNSSCVIDP